MFTKKDLISINQQFASGQVINGSSLDFVLEQTYRSKHWFKTMCLLIRSIVIDHVFEDGNKRTATAVIMAYLDMQEYHYQPEKVAWVVLKITKSNIKNINTIGRLIKNVIE